MSAAKPTVKKTSSKSASGPSYEAMIKEAILAHPEERAGLGRVTIKKYLHQKHPETGKIPEASFNSHVNRAITKGHEKKIFVLPKGISGKIKLAPEAKKAATKKPAVKKPAAKKPAAKKPAAKPAAAKKTTTAKKPAAKKAAPAKKTTSSTAAKAKKPAAKKTETKKAAPKKKVVAKKA